MTQEANIQRARDAAELIAHPLIVEAFEAIDARLMAAWTATRDDDVAGRERLWLSRKVLSGIRGHLQHVIATGEVDLKQIEAERSRRKWFEGLMK